MRLYFTLNGTTYPSGATVPITSIGVSDGEDAGSSLMCVTSNVNTMCCRGADNPNGGAQGNWLWPNGTIVNANPNGTITRSDYNQQIRFNRKRTDVLSPTGTYSCVVPAGSDNTKTHTANITLGEYM